MAIFFISKWAELIQTYFGEDFNRFIKQNVLKNVLKSDYIQ